MMNGMHKMPDGKMMKNSDMKKKTAKKAVKKTAKKTAKKMVMKKMGNKY